jgi:hypothetical protein
MGVGLGAVMGLGAAMAGAIGQATAVVPREGVPVAPASQGAGLVEGFAGLKNLVAQQLTLAADEKQEAAAALDALLLQLTSSTATMADVKVARQAVTGRFAWLESPVDTLLSTPAALQMLGQIAARSI